MVPRVIASLLVLAVGAGCSEDTPTQVIVIFDAEPAVEERAARLVIFLWNDEREQREWDIDLGDGPEAADLPVRLPMVPRDGDASRRYEVVGELYDADGALLGRQRAIGGYVEGELREILLVFTADCLGLACGQRSTCRGEACVGACVVPAPPGQSPMRVDCGDEPIDAGGPPADAGISDDAGPLPDGGPADPTGCDDVHADALFCDGFEVDYAMRWDHVRETNAVLGRDSDRVHRGVGALRAEATDARAFGYVATDAMDGLTETELFVRFWVWVPSGVGIDRINLVYAGESMSPWGGMAFGLIDDGRVFADPNPSEEMLQTATRAMPRDRWTCLEARLVMDEVDGALEFWIDGELAGTESGLDTFPDSGFQSFNFGLALTEFEQPPITLWFDELVVDTTRIGCE